MSCALIPVKALSATKSRLLPELGQAALARLALAMLEDVIAALHRTPSVRRIAVVTPDERVAALAKALGAEPLVGPDPGLNAAIDASAGQLALSSEDPLLVVLGDVAGASGEDFEAMHRRADSMPRPRAVLAPSRDGGTSALLRDPHAALPSRFGAQSARRHREAADAAGLHFAELPLESLAIDLDRAEDVDAFLALEAGGDRTRAVLADLGWPAPGPNPPAVLDQATDDPRSKEKPGPVRTSVCRRR